MRSFTILTFTLLTNSIGNAVLYALGGKKKNTTLILGEEGNPSCHVKTGLIYFE